MGSKEVIWAGPMSIEIEARIPAAMNGPHVPLELHFASWALEQSVIVVAIKHMVFELVSAGKSVNTTPLTIDC
ncbi:hypothetical protein SNOG_03443 [Parastagonospora nodorum SN15]|uniref:Uncharacterized protein n=1 Tax=Phaeosphaeria nodorum (strain SN15 / ATCC MYA-4574 / FGSC 10173) TaxID=321614 RepID=Q0UXS1_PHANO|nr:hypothetical protein SNOG_03443 [Parastagonospora nodorum SN15]EAT88648.1 hypothetical protein SNOG_03443 [Parastagonospora nodorum SN15]